MDDGPAHGPRRLRAGAAVEPAALVAFLAGLAASVPFMNTTLFEGAVARILHGADIAYYVGMVVAGALYYLLSRATSTRRM
jgi:NCS1 family nucleobase:cation symporter-1